MEATSRPVPMINAEATAANLYTIDFYFVYTVLTNRAYGTADVVRDLSASPIDPS